MAKKSLSVDELYARREAVFDDVAGEFDKNRYWDAGRTPDDSGGAEQYDWQKSVDTWASWMELLATQARQAAFGSRDKSEALRLILKAVTIGITCLIYNPQPED